MTEEERTHAQEPIQRGTDHRDAEGVLGGGRGAGVVSEVRDQRRDVLQVALEVWWVGGVGGEAASEPGGGEGEAEVTTSGGAAGRIDAQGDGRKKLLTPRTRRGAVDRAMKEKGHSQRRACGLVGMDPRVYRHRSTRPDDGAIRQRLRELAAERRRFGYRQGVEP